MATKAHHMAKAKAKPPAVVEPSPTGEPEPETVTELETKPERGDIYADDDDLVADETELGEAVEGAKWHLSKYLPNGRLGQCASYGLGQINVDVIREVWGVGRYHLRLRRNGKIVSNRLVEIVARGDDVRLGSAAPPTPASSSPAPGNDLRTILAELDARNERMFDRFLKVVETMRPPAQSEQSTMSMALQIADRISPKDRESSTDTLLKGIRLARELGGAAAGEKGWFDLGERALGMAEPVIERLTGKEVPRPQNHQQPQQPARPALEGPAEHVNGSKPPVLDLVSWLTQTVRTLIPKAKAGKSPQLWAEATLDELPESLDANTVLEALKSPGALDKLFSVLPKDVRVDAQSHAEWFRSFQVAMVEWLEDWKAQTPAPPEQDASSPP